MTNSESDVPFRVAFLTPEFPTEQASAGGVGNYAFKMASALIAHNVEAEVFVPSGHDEVLDYFGVRVERVAASRSIPWRAAARIFRPVIGSRATTPMDLINARRLAQAMERRHRVAAFDVVQSSNYQLTGAFVKPVAGRQHFARISTSRRLYDMSEKALERLMARWLELLDVKVLRRANRVYAPSQFLADYFRRWYDIDVQVLRPPAELGIKPGALPPGLPQRYLLHFGSLGRRKGTDVIARALPIAWEIEPNLEMVWVGPIATEDLRRYRDTWGIRAKQVSSLGPLRKPELYAVLAGAVASVLPSRIDNLPNTVIESLVLGVPVIGSEGASIDELVIDGLNGALVPMDDVRALAEAMTQAWRGQGIWGPADFISSPVLDEMLPAVAVQRFRQLAEQVSSEQSPR